MMIKKKEKQAKIIKPFVSCSKPYSIRRRRHYHRVCRAKLIKIYLFAVAFILQLFSVFFFVVEVQTNQEIRTIVVQFLFGSFCFYSFLLVSGVTVVVI